MGGKVLAGGPWSYEWDGIAPVPPEMWLLPRWFPLHPGKFWCHCRMVYLPMCYLYGVRFTHDVKSDPVAIALRCELYPGLAYDDIPWSAHLQSVAEIDNYSPIHWLMQFLQWSLTFYERLGPISFLRRASLKYAEAYMKAEDEETNFLTIGPVSKSLHMVCAWVLAGGQQDVNCKSDAVEAHIARVPAYLWVAEDA